jgi:hypothetical protein
VEHRNTSTSLGALLLACFFACNSETPAEVVGDAGHDAAIDSSGTTFVDAGNGTPDSAGDDTGLADVPPDGPLCSGSIPGYVPPPFHPVAMQACTSADIDAYDTACGPDDTNPQCLAWKADPANATCKACILRDDHTGPLRFYYDGTYASLNEGGCLALAGNPACGAQADAYYYCLFEACGHCPTDDPTLTGACYEGVSKGDCKSYGDAQESCESTLTGPIVDCEDMNMLSQQRKKTLTLFCGIPDEAGPPGDAGPGDASDAAPGDAGDAGDAGGSETGAGDATPE